MELEKAIIIYGLCKDNDVESHYIYNWLLQLQKVTNQVTEYYKYDGIDLEYKAMSCMEAMLDILEIRGRDGQ